MRQYRARRRAVGLKLERRWVAAHGDAPFSDHRLLDLRSLALHAAIARKLRARPALLEKARTNLSRWMATADPKAKPALQEWSELLELPLAEIARAMTDWNETAIRRRQSSPFAGVLTPLERKAIYEAFRA